MRERFALEKIHMGVDWHICIVSWTPSSKKILFLLSNQPKGGRLSHSILPALTLRKKAVLTLYCSHFLWQPKIFYIFNEKFETKAIIYLMTR